MQQPQLMAMKVACAPDAPCNGNNGSPGVKLLS